MTTQKQHIDYANGLRQIAAWIEAHPNIPLPTDTLGAFACSTREHSADLIRALSPCKKVYPKDDDPSGLVFIRRDFGPITLEFVFYRREVCERVVVGTEEVPEQVIPEKVIPASTREIVKWECRPMLEDAA